MSIPQGLPGDGLGRVVVCVCVRCIVGGEEGLVRCGPLWYSFFVRVFRVCFCLRIMWEMPGHWFRWGWVGLRVGCVFGVREDGEAEFNRWGLCECDVGWWCWWSCRERGLCE